MAERQLERRRHADRIRRRRRFATRVGVGVVLLAALATAGVVTSEYWGTKAAGPPKRTPTQIVLRPHGPIPGYLLIADRGNDRMLLVDGARHIFWRYPGGTGGAMPFYFDDDTFFGPKLDRIISNQEDQNTIQIISFPGRKLLWHYGHVNIKSARPGYLNTPDDAYLLRNGLVTVADAYNCRVIWISRAHRIVQQYGTAGSCRHDPPRYLGAVNGATPLPDGGTLISEIAGSWIDDIGPNGKLRWAVQAPVSYPSDPQLLSANRILLADYSQPGAAIIMNRRGQVVWRYSPQAGTGALNHPSLALRIAPGLIAINDDYRDRVVIVSVRRRKIVWQYGHTDQPGKGPGYLNTPDGLDLLSLRGAQASKRLVRLLAPHTRRTAPVKRPSATPTTTGGARLQISTPYHLPAPVEREVATASRNSVVVAGGLDANGASTSGVFRLNPFTGGLTSLGSVPQAFHDAAGALLHNRLYIFGGGSAQSTSTVQTFDLGTRRGSIAGHLPRALSDISAASVGRNIYLVGGYDGRVPRNEIYTTTDGRHFRIAGRLPVGLRYPAVATADGGVVIAGGTSQSGASARVFFFDPLHNNVRLIGTLPAPVAHAEALVFGGIVYVLGGVNRAGTVTGPVTAIDPRSGKIARVAGSLPIRDGATVQTSSFTLVIGGGSAKGTTSAIERVARG